MVECRYFPECQRCNESGDSWLPCAGGSDGTRCHGYEPMPDVDALMALAGKLDKDADNITSAARNAQFTGGRPRMEEAKHDAYEWRQIARSIREALGVES